jgi:hypothetical protein
MAWLSWAQSIARIIAPPAALFLFGYGIDTFLNVACLVAAAVGWFAWRVTFADGLLSTGSPD